jgi:hypothetical protein
VKGVKDVKEVRPLGRLAHFTAFLRLASVWLLAGALLAAQNKPTVTVAGIEACAKALNCKNMKQSSLSWYDQVDIRVVEFSEEGQKYALAAGQRGLSIWIALKSESRPSRVLSVDVDGKVVSASQFALPPGGRWPRQLTPEESAKLNKDRRALIPAMGNRGPIGEEYRAAWQDEADRALAAIHRQLAK